MYKPFSFIACIIIYVAAFTSETFAYTLTKDSTCYAILVIKNGKEFKENKSPYTYSRNGFYLIRNVVYDLSFTDGKDINGRIIEIGKDSLKITSDFNKNIADLRKEPFKILTYAIKDIKMLRMIAERDMNQPYNNNAYPGSYRSRYNDPYNQGQISKPKAPTISYDKLNAGDYIFKSMPNTTACEQKAYKVVIPNDNYQAHDCFYYLTASGMKLFFEFNGGKRPYGTGIGKLNPAK